jgi:hypothetical protein
MTIQPNTEIRLVENVGLSNDYKYQMDFNNSTDQALFFISKAKHTFYDFTYQRELNAIKVPIPYDDIVQVNYLMYKNISFTGKWFYGFITRKEYINPNTTRIYFEMDVYQTYLFEMEWLPSFVVREHTDRWNEDGSPVVNTLDEGLFYGDEYETVSIEQYKPYQDLYFLVIITKERMDTTFQSGIYPTINGLPQPLSYYVHPFKLDGTNPNIMLAGEGAGLSNIKDLLQGLYKNENAVNNVVSLYVTDYIGIPMNYNPTYSEYEFSRNVFSSVGVSDGVNTFTTLHLNDFTDYEPQEITFPNVWDAFNDVSESKLFMYPYTVTILDDFKGNRIELHNEYLRDGNLVIQVKGSIGTSNKTAYTVKNYMRARNAQVEDSEILGLEKAVINNNPNDLPILNEYLSAFLQGNRNSLENQANSTFFNGVLSIIGGVASGNVGAMVGNTGNAFFSIQALNAKIKDINNMPPSMSSMGGNTYFDYGNGINGLFIIKKQITYEHRQRLTEFFQMFGYKVNRLKIPNLKTREHFNYVETIGANIKGNIPHEYLEKIKNVFNSGVTIWHGDYVGDYSKVNLEV